jgi:hypothetical protein
MEGRQYGCSVSYSCRGVCMCGCAGVGGLDRACSTIPIPSLCDRSCNGPVSLSTCGLAHNHNSLSHPTHPPTCSPNRHLVDKSDWEYDTPPGPQAPAAAGGAGSSSPSAAGGTASSTAGPQQSSQQQQQQQEVAAGGSEAGDGPPGTPTSATAGAPGTSSSSSQAAAEQLGGTSRTGSGLLPSTPQPAAAAVAGGGGGVCGGEQAVGPYFLEQPVREYRGEAELVLRGSCR